MILSKIVNGFIEIAPVEIKSKKDIIITINSASNKMNGYQVGEVKGYDPMLTEFLGEDVKYILYRAGATVKVETKMSNHMLVSALDVLSVIGLEELEMVQSPMEADADRIAYGDEHEWRDVSDLMGANKGRI